MSIESEPGRKVRPQFKNVNPVRISGNTPCSTVRGFIVDIFAFSGPRFFRYLHISFVGSRLNPKPTLQVSGL